MKPCICKGHENREMIQNWIELPIRAGWITDNIAMQVNGYSRDFGFEAGWLTWESSLIILLAMNKPDNKSLFMTKP